MSVSGLVQKLYQSTDGKAGLEKTGKKRVRKFGTQDFYCIPMPQDTQVDTPDKQPADKQPAAAVEDKGQHAVHQRGGNQDVGER